MVCSESTFILDIVYFSYDKNEKEKRKKEKEKCKFGFYYKAVMVSNVREIITNRSLLVYYKTLGPPSLAAAAARSTQQEHEMYVISMLCSP